LGCAEEIEQNREVDLVVEALGWEESPIQSKPIIYPDSDGRCGADKIFSPLAEEFRHLFIVLVQQYNLH